ncbi:MAG: response regulator transcription factor, partial [Lewinella sp.]|nr:response regulator transcription factor [Lewinella sp.]
IFTTAYDQYAIQAFQVNAVDYLLKPIKREDLRRAIGKYQARFTAPAGSAAVDYQELARAILQENQKRRFLIRLGQQIRLVGLDEVAYAYTESKITFLVTRTGKRYPVDYSLDKLDEMMPDDAFFRINRQFIIGIHAIDEMLAYSKSRVKLTLNPPCELETVVSTERSPIFKQWLGTY